MSQKQNLMTTSEFAKKSGLPTAKVSELIRAGRIKAKKVSGRWQIDKEQLKAKAVQQFAKPASAKKKIAAKAGAPKPKKEKAPASRKFYSISEFAAMTYLTEKGVMEWLRNGRLTGRKESSGEWTVDSANLQVADISRLVR